MIQNVQDLFFSKFIRDCSPSVDMDSTSYNKSEHSWQFEKKLSSFTKVLVLTQNAFTLSLF